MPLGLPQYANAVSEQLDNESRYKKLLVSIQKNNYQDKLEIATPATKQPDEQAINNIQGLVDAFNKDVVGLIDTIDKNIINDDLREEENSIEYTDIVLKYNKMMSILLQPTINSQTRAICNERMLSALPNLNVLIMHLNTRLHKILRDNAPKALMRFKYNVMTYATSKLIYNNINTRQYYVLTTQILLSNMRDVVDKEFNNPYIKDYLAKAGIPTEENYKDILTSMIDSEATGMTDPELRQKYNEIYGKNPFRMLSSNASENMLDYPGRPLAQTSTSASTPTSTPASTPARAPTRAPTVAPMSTWYEQEDDDATTASTSTGEGRKLKKRRQTKPKRAPIEWKDEDNDDYNIIEKQHI